MAEDDNDELEDLNEDAEGGEEEASSEPSWGSTIVVNDVTYAVSLFWQPLQDTNDPYPEVKETVENVMEGADLFCTRSGTAAQYGIGNSAEGHKVGMPSAAAAIAEVFQDKQSSVAVFEVDEGWWFIAVRNDLILSEEDVLYLNEDDAKRAFYAMMAVPDWGRKIAPASWDIEGTEEVDLWDILPPTSSSKLMHVNKTNPKTKLIILGAGLLVLFIGWKLIFGASTTQKKPVLRPLTPMVVEEEEVEVKQVEKKVIVYPWEKMVVTEDLLNRCYIAVAQLKSFIAPGWEMERISCTPSGASTTFRKQWGSISWFKRTLQENIIPGMDYIIDDSGSNILVSLAIGEVSLHSEKPAMMSFEAREELNTIFQAISQRISLKDERTVFETSVDQNGLGTITKEIKTYPKLIFGFSSDWPMEEWIKLFNKFPALEITKLTYDNEDNLWTYEGRIYEPLI